MMVRQMMRQDIEQLVQMEKLCFSDPWSISAFEYELNNPLSLWLVCVEEEQVLGYIGSQRVLPEADIMNVAVLPEYRKRGIAKALILKLLDCLHQKGVCQLSLEVRASNFAAISLYEKLGFCQVGRRPGYYRHPKEDALILRKELPSCEF